jgi:5'-3' exonuclease
MGKVEEKVACQYCGKMFSKAGVANHEKSCHKNPANIEKEDEVKAPQVEEVKEETVVKEAPEVTEEEVVKVKLKQNLECYIGDKYYRFKAFESYDVPENVKNILKGAGVLEAI